MEIHSISRKTICVLRPELQITVTVDRRISQDTMDKRITPTEGNELPLWSKSVEHNKKCQIHWFQRRSGEECLFPQFSR